MVENIPLTKEEIEDVLEIFDFGFSKHLINYKTDASGLSLTADEILSLLDARHNPENFSNYSISWRPCETCGGHGDARVDLNGKTFVIKEY